MSIDRIHDERRTPTADRLSPQRPSGAATGGLLVAIDDQSDSLGVFSVAELLARRERANAHLVGVAAMPQADLPARLTIDEREALLEHQRDRLRKRTKRRLHNAVGRAVYWSTDAALGALPEILAEQAGRRRPQLIVLALNQLQDASRLRDAEGVMRVADAVDVPVLVVPPHQELLFERALVATDFSSSSARAARMALSVMAPRGQLAVIHVEPDIDFEARGHAGWRDANAKGVVQLLDVGRDADPPYFVMEYIARGSLAQHLERAGRLPLGSTVAIFEEIRQMLDEEGHPNQPGRSVVARTISLHGEVASAILDYAVRHKCDLIALGGRRIPDDGSLPLGSVSLAVLLAARCAVLIAPPEPRSVQLPVRDA